MNEQQTTESARATKTPAATAGTRVAPARADAASIPGAAPANHAIVELNVTNHAGVMSHIVGLFARRAWNVDGILVLPVAGGRTSRVWLRVAEDARLEQMLRQTAKLEDVLSVERHGADHEVFARVEGFFQ